MLNEIIAILAGLVLLTGMMSAVPAIGKYLDQIGNLLLPLKTVIGVIALILGVLSIFNGVALLDVMLVLAGLLLVIEILDKVPAIGDALKKFAHWLAPGQAVIGVITIIVAVLALL